MEPLRTDLGSTGDYLKWLSDALTDIQNAEEARDRIVIALRAKGASWRSIGEVLGISKQGAMARYRHLAPWHNAADYLYQTPDEKKLPDENDTP